MNKQDKIEELQTSAFLDGITKERRRLSAIIWYILSKNTTGKAFEEIIDFEGVHRDLEDFNTYLLRKDY